MVEIDQDIAHYELQMNTEGRTDCYEGARVSSRNVACRGSGMPH